MLALIVITVSASENTDNPTPSTNVHTNGAAPGAMMKASTPSTVNALNPPSQRAGWADRATSGGKTRLIGTPRQVIRPR
jgi:hypothetical protein